MEKVQLGTLVKITSGFAFKSNLFNTDKKGLPLIRIRDVVRGYSDTYYDGEYKAEYLIQKGDALIGMDGEFNLALWNCGKALLNQRVCKIQSIDERLDQNYLIRFLPKALKDIEDRTPFVTVKHLSVKDINNIQIPLPPLEEQRRIASILDQADELRQKRQQAIEKLDQLLQATFIDMFGDPVSNPKGWDLVNLESLLAKKLISGAYFPKETYVNSGGVPMVHMGDVFYGVVKPDNLKQVNISNEEIKKYKITNKDILIARRSLTYDGAAKACLVECSNQDMIFESSLIRLSPNLVKILPEFLYHYLNNNDVRNKFIIPYITKSTISGINQANLNKVTVLLPPLAKQEKFIEICDKFKQFGKPLLMI
ncbi:restriction endonuclease subunit S [Acinetobacter bereziniae]|uniref:restriction endonuclease subunit S n=1 Tax=Acinetobacter bereziniae TaxID=106648 RepID=UPI0020C5D12F|nr:restriction endonuclease subunit S [Acinetobacter bereziniae]